MVGVMWVKIVVHDHSVFIWFTCIGQPVKPVKMELEGIKSARFVVQQLVHFDDKNEIQK
jgi:hypothetical protein